MKLHQDPEFLRQAVSSGKNSRDIARDIGVSWKLVEIYLRKYNIKHTPHRRET